VRVLYFSERRTVHDRRFLAGYAAAGAEISHLRLCAADERDVEAPEGVESLAWPAPLWELEAVESLRSEQLAATYVVGLADVLRAGRFDAIHAGPIPTCGWLAARAGAAPLIVQSWGSDLLYDAVHDDVARERAGVALAASSLVQCDSHAVRAVLLSDYNVPEDHIVQFPWGVDADLFSPGDADTGVRSREGLSDAVVAISNRAWEPLYGVMTVLEGFELAAKNSSALGLVLLGSGSLEHDIHDFLDRSALATRVFVAGRVPNSDLVSYLRDADIYISGSLSDGASISLLEAMATELPAVVSDIPGNREWIEPGVGGYLFPTGDAEKLAESLVALARDAALRREMGLRNRREAVARATWASNFGLLYVAVSSVARGVVGP